MGIITFNIQIFVLSYFQAVVRYILQQKSDYFCLGSSIKCHNLHGVRKQRQIDTLSWSTPETLTAKSKSNWYRFTDLSRKFQIILMKIILITLELNINEKRKVKKLRTTKYKDLTSWFELLEITKIKARKRTLTWPITFQPHQDGETLLDEDDLASSHVLFSLE